MIMGEGTTKNNELKPGTWVRTADELQSRDFTGEALRARRPGALGTVQRGHTKLGLCYSVRLVDGTTSAYDPDELTVVEEEHRVALRFVLKVIRNDLMLFSPDRVEALRLAELYGITAADLLAYARKRAEDTT